jgi:beta-galactosidase
MAHGGTTFGLWAGCDHPFKPDISSYDYDAPISEAGWPTDKFFKTRELFSRYLQPGERLPEPPPRNPSVAVAPFKLHECAPVFANLPKPVSAEQPGTMESYAQGYGCILYRTQLPAGPAGVLKAASIHDFGYVFLAGQRIGITDRRNRDYQLHLPARAKTAVLDILVEPMGRVNYGADINDHKGLLGPVSLITAGTQTNTLTGWQVFNLPLDSTMLAGLHFASSANGVPAFWRGQFHLTQPADTFLDLRSWGKGVVWVNGRCLGRFWNIGPTQTAYAPGPWLHAGENEIVILDLLGPGKPLVAGLEQPILDELRPQLDFTARPAKTGP